MYIVYLHSRSITFEHDDDIASHPPHSRTKNGKLVQLRENKHCVIYAHIIRILFVTACNCNGLATKCFFDRNLYNLTGHGGHCIDCQRNRDGPNCERCKENFVMRPDGYCVNCDCDPVGE